MPEGDTLRRLASRISKRYVGQTVVRSVFRHPRLALLDLAGRTLVSVDATGKHLLCRFDHGKTLHLHLLMQGRVRMGVPAGVPDWRRRFELHFETGQLVGVDIPLLHLLDTDREQLMVGHLGPDLCGSYDHDVAVARLEAVPDIPLSGALLDQRVVAGFGNVYAVEVPFICGVSPFLLVGDLTEVAPVLAVGAALIRTNATRGPQNTTGRRLDRSEHWILPAQVRRCPICGSVVRRSSQDQTPWRRITAWCEHCQADQHASVDLKRVRRLLALHPARRMLDLETGELVAETSQPCRP